MRWIPLPRIPGIQAQLVPFIIGIAIGEEIALYGAFLVGPDHPQAQLAFYSMSFFAVLQFIPLFAQPNKFDPNARRAPTG